MNVASQDLDEWARLAFRANRELQRILAGAPVSAPASTAQQTITRLIHQLQAAGAADPVRAMQVAEYGEEVAATLRSAQTPIELLASPAARRYAEAIRAAAVACAEMERERNLEDGMAEVLGDYADIAETEVFGPASMRGMD